MTASGMDLEVKVTHEQLRKSAVRWLSNTKKCSVVLSEMVSGAWETPDAVGWHGGHSILVECKVSRGDFMANQEKPCIRGGRGVGIHRYFLVPEGLVSVDEVPDGWGLLALGQSGNVRERKAAERRETDWCGEVIMLTSALRRVRTREFLTLNVVEGSI